MKCIVCGTRMHYQNFSKVLKDENFLGWKNKKKPVTTENIKKHEIGFVRSYFLKKSVVFDKKLCRSYF